MLQVDCVLLDFLLDSAVAVQQLYSHLGDL